MFLVIEETVFYGQETLPVGGVFKVVGEQPGEYHLRAVDDDGKVGQHGDDLRILTNSTRYAEFDDLSEATAYGQELENEDMNI
jgi:hypothetical protein